MSTNPYEPPNEEPRSKSGTKHFVFAVLVMLAIVSIPVASFVTCGLASEAARPIQDYLYPDRSPHDEIVRMLLRMFWAGLPVGLVAMIGLAIFAGRLLERFRPR